MKPLEEKITDPVPPSRTPDPEKQEAIESAIKETLTEPVVEQGAEEERLSPDAEGTVMSIRFRGDAEWLEQEGTATMLRALLLGASAEDLQTIRDTVARQREALVDRQFYLANLWVGGFDEETGELLINVDAGRVGAINFSFKEDNPHFTEKQLRRRLGDVESGSVFNYADIYRYVYDVNSHPDIVMDTFFNVESRIEEGVLKREIETNFVVEDSLPVHGVLYLNNFGSEATENWQVGATLQHLNLTNRDDVLTIDVPVAVDFGSLVSFGASYSLPYFSGNGGRWTTYGGYSTLDTPNVVPAVDINGEGYFGGLQWSHNLIKNDGHLLSGSLGVVHRYIEDQLVVQGFDTEPRSANVSPFSAAISYSQVKPDRLGGRNMFTVQGLANFGGVLGASEDEEIQTLRPAAEADYLIARMQAARIQPLFGKLSDDGTMDGQWVLFMKADGQFADGPLIPAEQIGVGGATTVRGYIEREFFGDDGAYANIEIRTPMVFGLFSNLFSLPAPEAGGYPSDRIQGILFVDAGYTRIQTPLPSEDDGEAVYSAGLGFRFAFSDHTQLRFDWGFPFEETLSSDTSGTGHLELQIQF